MILLATAFVALVFRGKEAGKTTLLRVALKSLSNRVNSRLMIPEIKRNGYLILIPGRDMLYFVFE
ncbi:MAG: hypothetical protein CVT99_01245 [Bacteroidetes bacterium HGW-Bacteroidetes-16]|nr:MAG: hypothetical protein CVT99_01245 [Bacteroidetes bacterium HGW-Bacteroidetes-16]